MSTRRWRSRRSARPFAAHSPESVPTGIPERTSIFVTVGTELPFDRLVRAIDHWAGERGRGSEVFAQIGRTQFRPEHIGWAPLIDGNAFRQLFDHADLIVAHAGMGTILGALERSRPLIVVPRRAQLGEHRNEHQLATVARLAERELIDVAQDEVELIEWLDRGGHCARPRHLGPSADPRLIAAVRSAITSSRRA